MQIVQLSGSHGVAEGHSRRRESDGCHPVLCVQLSNDMLLYENLCAKNSEMSSTEAVRRTNSLARVIFRALEITEEMIRDGSY